MRNAATRIVSAPGMPSTDGAGSTDILVTILGNPIGRKFDLVDYRPRAVFGRDPEVDISIDDDSVSRQHCELCWMDGAWVVRDLGSTNGTRVNGSSIGEARYLLKVDDRIRLSKRVLLKFSLQDAIESELQADLYSSAMRDGLTGAFNKRFLLDRMEEEFAHARRHGRALALLVLDLDHFKKINDTFGHSAGDQVLIMAAELIQANLRTEDICARYGGEEFVVLMRDTDLDTAVRVAERIRKSLLEEEVLFEGTPIRTAVSIGVTAMPPVRAATAMDFFVQGDKLLYQARETRAKR